MVVHGEKQTWKSPIVAWRARNHGSLLNLLWLCPGVRFIRHSLPHGLVVSCFAAFVVCSELLSLKNVSSPRMKKASVLSCEPNSSWRID